MDEIFLLIQARLADQVKVLTIIDMDWGQLETQEETYPVTFPCALIDIPDVVWEKTGVTKQPGTVTVRVKVAINMLDDTHFSSGTVNDAVARLQVARDSDNALKLYLAGSFTQLDRTHTRQYNLPGAIKVVETEYETVIQD